MQKLIALLLVASLEQVAQAKAGKGSGSKTCHTGPRGGTYTVTASGNKNYSGC